MTEYSLGFNRDEGRRLVRALHSHDAELCSRVQAMLDPPTHTCGGGIDQTAVIGHAPEHADWRPGDPAFAPVIDRTARIEAYVTVDSGSERPTTIGARTWLLKNGTHIGHDALVGDDVVIACGAKIGGHCVIGDGAFVGLNATVAPFRSIGAGAQVEAGSVVIHDVPDGTRVGGNPARVLGPRRTDKFTERTAEERAADELPAFEDRQTIDPVPYWPDPTTVRKN